NPPFAALRASHEAKTRRHEEREERFVQNKTSCLSWAPYGAVGLPLAGRTFSVTRIGAGLAAAAADGVGVLKADDSRSGSSKFALTSPSVPRPRVIGCSAP